MSNACCHCGTTSKELRPYGPGGTWVCFPCAMGTPERKSEAERQLGAALNAAERSDDVIMIGEATGPRPMRRGGDA